MPLRSLRRRLRKTPDDRPVLPPEDVSSKERKRLIREEMRVYDALGPNTRKVISDAPVSLDARKLPNMTQMSLSTLQRRDDYIAVSLRRMLEAEYGSTSGE